jgi:hypothetical protein
MAFNLSLHQTPEGSLLVAETVAGLVSWPLKAGMLQMKNVIYRKWQHCQIR